VTGAMTTWPGVAELLREELNLPVLPAGRDAWPDLGTVSVAPERLDVAVGLALATGDERPDLRPTRSRAEQRDAAPDARVAQVVCGVASLLAALVVYLVILSNQISSGQERLVQIGSEVTASEREAAALKPYADFAKATTDRRATVKRVAVGRFAWDRTMRELSQVVPGDVWLTSVKGTLSTTSTVEGVGGGSGLRGALPGPALELEGCGKREGDVPKYMDRLYAISGVENVGFTKSERVEQRAAGAAGAAGAGASAGACSGSDSASTFSLVTYFQQSAAGAAAGAPATVPATGGGAAARAVTPDSATPAPTTPAATGAPK
jgi:Tfp pilus assembly protein PilN